jgi:hypothetical protein
MVELLQQGLGEQFTGGRRWRGRMGAAGHRAKQLLLAMSRWDGVGDKGRAHDRANKAKLGRTGTSGQRQLSHGATSPKVNASNEPTLALRIVQNEATWRREAAWLETRAWRGIAAVEGKAYRILELGDDTWHRMRQKSNAYHLLSVRLRRGALDEVSPARLSQGARGPALGMARPG